MERGTKRPNPDSSASPLHPALFGSVSKLKQQYAESQPYRHVVIPELCLASNMRNIREEILNLEATFKETDMFKVYQVRSDLCSLGLNLPGLLSLRDALYTQEFRNFVSEVTGCGPLTAKVDCSANCYSSTCHLLCHDDTIGTRRISYIIYLSNEDWVKEDGGALLMFPIVGGKVLNRPSKELLPLFNTLCMFQVVPGLSYHSVQEVLSDKSRISIQGWFHAAEEPEGKLQASRIMLQTRAPEMIQRANDILGPFIPLAQSPSTEQKEEKIQTKQPAQQEGEEEEEEGDEGDEEDAIELCPEDVEELRQWVSDSYVKHESIAQIRAHFKGTSTIQLREFLKPAVAAPILANAEQADKEDRRPEGFTDYDKAMRPGWSLMDSPQLHHYFRLDPSSSTPASSSSSSSSSPFPASESSSKLNDGFRHIAGLMQSGAFARLLHALTGQRCVGVRSSVRRFCPGLSYTLASPLGLTETTRLDVTLCFVAPSPLWEADEVGGFQTYMPAAAAEENADQAATYEADDDGEEVLQVNAMPNALNLVLHRPGIYKFVKYVSGLAPGSRWDIAAEFERAQE